MQFLSAGYTKESPISDSMGELGLLLRFARDTCAQDLCALATADWQLCKYMYLAATLKLMPGHDFSVGSPRVLTYNACCQNDLKRAYPEHHPGAFYDDH